MSKSIAEIEEQAKLKDKAQAFDRLCELLEKHKQITLFHTPPAVEPWVMHLHEGEPNSYIGARARDLQTAIHCAWQVPEDEHE